MPSISRWFTKISDRWSPISKEYKTKVDAHLTQLPNNDLTKISLEAIQKGQNLPEIHSESLRSSMESVEQLWFAESKDKRFQKVFQEKVKNKFASSSLSYPLEQQINPSKVYSNEEQKIIQDLSPQDLKLITSIIGLCPHFETRPTSERQEILESARKLIETHSENDVQQWIAFIKTIDQNDWASIKSSLILAETKSLAEIPCILNEIKTFILNDIKSVVLGDLSINEKEVLCLSLAKASIGKSLEELKQTLYRIKPNILRYFYLLSEPTRKSICFESFLSLIISTTDPEVISIIEEKLRKFERMIPYKEEIEPIDVNLMLDLVGFVDDFPPYSLNVTWLVRNSSIVSSLIQLKKSMSPVREGLSRLIESEPTQKTIDALIQTTSTQQVAILKYFNLVSTTRKVIPFESFFSLMKSTPDPKAISVIEEKLRKFERMIPYEEEIEPIDANVMLDLVGFVDDFPRYSLNVTWLMRNSSIASSLIQLKKSISPMREALLHK